MPSLESTKEPDLYKLHYYPLNASMAPHFVLEALGVKHELLLVDRDNNAQKSPEYLALNPTGRIPVLVDGDRVVCESAAICIYLCEKHPESHLIPESIEMRAKFFQWLMYLTSTLQAEQMIYFYAERHTADQSGVSSIRKAQYKRIIESFALVDKELRGNNYLLGNDITVCDYFLFMLCVWSEKLSVVPLGQKNLGSYLRRMATRPEIERVCRHEDLDLERLTRREYENQH